VEFFTQLFGTQSTTLLMRLMSQIETPAHLISSLVDLVSKRSVMWILLIYEILVMSILQPMSLW
jgi:hypothetical protein